MCYELTVATNYGYRESLVINNTNYIWDKKCEQYSEQKTINVISDFKNNNSLIISGLALHLPLFLSAALNVSLKYIPVAFKFAVNFLIFQFKVLYHNNFFNKVVLSSLILTEKLMTA